MNNIQFESSKKENNGLAIKDTIGKLTKRFGSLLGLIILCILLTIASGQFLTFTNIMNIARQSSISILTSIGMLLVILTAGIDNSIGSVLSFSTCVMGIAIIKWGINPIIGMIICLLCGASFGFLNGILLTKLRLPHPFISTLGTKNIARGLALVITAASPISGFPASVQFLGGYSIGSIPMSLFLVIIVAVGFSIFLNKTAQGRYIYAVGGNKVVANLSGINVTKTLIICYTLSGTLAALAGIVLTGRVNSAFPLSGLDYELDGIAACIIGGASFMGGSGTVGGTIIGALIMAILRNGLNLLGVSADYQSVAIGIVIVGAVYVDVLRREAEKKVKTQAA